MYRVISTRPYRYQLSAAFGSSGLSSSLMAPRKCATRCPQSWQQHPSSAWVASPTRCSRTSHVSSAPDACVRGRQVHAYSADTATE